MEEKKDGGEERWKGALFENCSLNDVGIDGLLYWFLLFCKISTRLCRRHSSVMSVDLLSSGNITSFIPNCNT